jgi:hypothetical protein
MINKMSPGSGRMLKENGEYVNIADLFPGVVSGKVVGTGTAEFAAEATANTLKEVTITPEGNIKSALRLEVDNPSTESDMTIEVYNTIGEKDYFVDWFTIPKKQTRANGLTVEAHTRLLPPLAGDVKIAVSNDTTLTSAVDVTVTIREV